MTSRSGQYRIGFDIGGTKSHAVLLDAEGRVHRQTVTPTMRGKEALRASMLEIFGQLRSELGPSDEVVSVGIAIPGRIDSPHGVVRDALNLGLSEWWIADDLEQETGLRPQVDNDVNAAALGAKYLLGLEDSMAYLNLGTGVAAGFVLGGTPRSGVAGAAGEIGHIPIDPAGPVCDCGQTGCIEAFAGGRALSRRVPDEAYPLQALLHRARDGNLSAQLDVRNFVIAVVAAIRVIALSVDVRHIVVGGGNASLGGAVSAHILTELRRLEQVSDLIASLGLPDRIIFIDNSLPAPAIGATLLGTEP